MSDILLRAVLIASAMLPSAASANEFFGAWARGDGVAKVKVAPCGKQICMTDTYIKPGVADEKVGDKVIFDVKPTTDGSFTGTGFDPQRKLEFSVVIDINGDRMTTKGCKFGGIVCKSESWTRIR